ncbi:MAG: HD-GYP domain-containing protein [Clostridiales bacterium]|nr:HD-GYP domain-containing protein [Clostridiales bacterium]
MRYIPANCLQAGQILASNISISKKRILLRKGVALTSSVIKKIEQLGLQGVYIDDDISRDIEVSNVISDELKYKAKKGVTSFFLSAEQEMTQKTDKYLSTIKRTITDIVDEVQRNANVKVNIVDLRTYDDYTFSHSINVAVLSVVVGTVLGLDKKKLNELALGALIHDIGKVFYDKNIINKPGKLTPEEYEDIKRHSERGYNYLYSSISIPLSSKLAVLTHHEQFDGNGYPNRISAENIHLFGRIISVVDVYDALTSDRSYRKAMLPSQAFEYVLSGYNTMFDPVIVEAFIKKVAFYPVGTCVRLSSGVEGIVVENFESSYLRPLIRVIVDKKVTNERIDLAHDASTLNITIAEIIDI